MMIVMNFHLKSGSWVRAAFKTKGNAAAIQDLIFLWVKDYRLGH
jgi:hypothetical protein